MKGQMGVAGTASRVIRRSKRWDPIWYPIPCLYPIPNLVPHRLSGTLSSDKE